MLASTPVSSPWSLPKSIPILLRAALLVLCFSLPAPARSATYHIATDGSDAAGDGSPGNPWRTIAHAVNTGIPAQGGDTILVRNGLYDGPSILRRGFPTEVVVRSEEDHGAVLTNLTGGSTIMAVYLAGSANLVIEGFVFTGEGAVGPVCTVRMTNMIHFENASDITFRNNIVYGNNRMPFCNDLMKINRSGPPHYPRNIRILGNVFYNHPQVLGNDLIDSVRPGELEICDNILFSDLGVSAAQNFITLKREVPPSEAPPDAESPRYRICRNIFLNYEGNTNQAFLNFGEDGVATHEITDAVVENNLFIGNSPNSQAGPIQFKGTQGITVRANTVVGNLPSSAFGLQIGTTGSNPTVRDIFIHNNIWSDPTGTMGSVFLSTFGSVDLGSFVLDRNLFWNDGNPLPSVGPLTPFDDTSRVVGDPLLKTDHQDLVLPKWDTVTRRFQSGATTIRQEFERLVNAYGSIPASSPAVDAADPANAPADDILGRPRGSSPDLGAYEFDPATSVVQTPFDTGLFLAQNVPNPFHETSTIRFTLPSPGVVHLAVYDVRGRIVRVLLDGPMGRGDHAVSLRRDGLAGGVYFYRLRIGGEGGSVVERRCVVLR